MISDEILANIRVLMDDHSGMKGTGAAAAVFFREAAAAGEDLSSVIDDLLQTFLECHQLPMLNPLAGAIALHYLNRGQFEELDGILKKKAYGQYMMWGLFDLAKKGKDVSGLVPHIVKAFGYKGGGISRYDITNILIPFVKRSKKRLELVIRLMSEDPGAAGAVPWFINEYLKDAKGDLTEFIPALLGILKSPDEAARAESAKAVMNIAWNGGSVGGHLRDLEKLIDDGNAEVRRAISFTLGRFYAGEKDMANARRLASHPDTEVREGAVSALCQALKGEGADVAECAGLLAVSMTDPAAGVSEMAAGCLESAVRDGVEFSLGNDKLAMLAKALSGADNGARISNLLYEYCAKEPCRAAAFLETIAGMGIDKNSSAVSKIVKACEAAVGGGALGDCEICRLMPTSAVYSSDYDVPKTFEQLKYVPECGLRSCPACGAFYNYSRSEEWESPSDGMGVVITITLRRVPPSEVLSVLKGKELASYRLRYDKIIAGCVKSLGHFHKYAREHAAWDLLHHYLANNSTVEVEALMRHSDRTVRAFVSKTLADMAAAGTLAVAPLAAAMRSGLSDDQDAVRQNYSGALAIYYFDNDMRSEFGALLASVDPCVKKMALWHLARKAEEIDISPYMPCLLEMLLCSDDAVRVPAFQAVRRAPEKELPALMETVLKALAFGGAGVKSDALGLVRDMAHNAIDMSAAVPAISKLLPDTEEHGCIPVQYSAVCALAAAASGGADVSPAYPYLLEILREKGDSNSGNITNHLVLKMKGVDLTTAVPVFAKMLSMNKPSMGCALDALLDLAEKKKIDIAAAVNDLEKMILFDEEYDRRRAQNALTWHYINRKSWDRIAKFLEHERRDVRYVSAAILRDAARLGADISPLILPLVANLAHEFDYLRDNSFEALSHMVTCHNGYAGRVLEELEKFRKSARNANIRKLIDKCAELTR